MPKSRNRKKQKTKSISRNIEEVKKNCYYFIKYRQKQNEQDKKKKIEKMQREMIMNLIEQEKKKGLFENLQQINPNLGDTQLPIEGPSI